MNNRLAGKTAFVTGAGQGIGYAIATLFLEEGASVIAADINGESRYNFDGLKKVIFEQLDVTDVSAVARCAKKYSEVDVLVNCCGIVKQGSILDCTDADFDLSIAINTTAVFQCSKAFLPAMLSRKNGAIINIASVVSSNSAAANRFAYAASKGAVLAMTKSIAMDYIADGIRCNAISPGTIDSPSLHQRMRDSGNYEVAHRDFVARQPMKRIGGSAEVASIALMLASDEVTYMTGSEVVVDGGFSL